MGLLPQAQRENILSPAVQAMCQQVQAELACEGADLPEILPVRLPKRGDVRKDFPRPIFKRVKGKGTSPFPLSPHQPATAGCVRKNSGFSKEKVRNCMILPWGQFRGSGPDLEPGIFDQEMEVFMGEKAKGAQKMKYGFWLRSDVNQLIEDHKPLKKMTDPRL